MSYEKVKQAKNRKIGIKQTIKVIEQGKALAVIMAEDADPDVQTKIKKACKQKNIPISYVDSMRQLGRVCGIEVGAASVVIEE